MLKIVVIVSFYEYTSHINNDKIKNKMKNLIKVISVVAILFGYYYLIIKITHAETLKINNILGKKVSIDNDTLTIVGKKNNYYILSNTVTIDKQIIENFLISE